MKLVEVIDIPVRYNDERYFKGESFEMEDDHVNEKIVKVIGDATPKKSDVLDNQFEAMSIDELKEYAEQHNIDIGKASTEEGIIKKIQEVQKAE